MLGTIVAISMLGNFASATALKTPGIRGSDHDFARFLLTTSTTSATGTVTVKAYDEICIFCHAPHKNGPGQAGGDPVDAPLWNHQLSTATYTPYTSATMNAVPGQPNGTSKLCLSCHDGTMALEAYGKTLTGTHFISDAQFGTGSKIIGTDLTNDHPISFVYDQALAAADGALNDPTTATILPGLNSVTGTVAAELLDKGGQVQCTSCHDVHNGQGINKLLKVNNTGSALCLSCHNK
jgi:predicted CXXCH cytochrome family protein